MNAPATSSLMDVDFRAEAAPPGHDGTPTGVAGEPCLNKGSDGRKPACVPKPVSGKGRMTSAGYEPENAPYLDDLTMIVDGQRIGRDALSLDPGLLTAPGHGHRKPGAVMSALGDVSKVTDDPNHRLAGWRAVRAQCIACVGDDPDSVRNLPPAVRRCAIIDCPCWPYRTGRNPHDARRGRDLSQVRARREAGPC